MRLLIKDYLSMLKESGELDKLLPELLLAMKYKPISKAQVGVNQYGVDLAAVRKIKGAETLYLFVLKRGDLGRKDWQDGVNSIRSTLEQIEDVYLNSHISPEHKGVRKVIVLVTTGDMKQELDIYWNGYKNSKTVKNKMEFDFWGGDQLSIFLEDYLFSEHLLPEKDKSNFRKALALIGENEYDLSHFYELLESLLFQPTDEKKLVRSFRTINLALNIIFRWAESENNLNNAVKASERVVLWGWEAVRRNHLGKSKKVHQGYGDLFLSYLLVHQAYFKKLYPYLLEQDALSIYSSDNVLIVESLYEQLGILALVGLMQFSLKDLNYPIAPSHGAEFVCDALMKFIDNNPSISSPCYDEHGIEITLALLLLKSTNQHSYARGWLAELISRLTYTYGSGRNFPVGNDSFEDLIEFNFDPSEGAKAKLQQISTLVPILTQWSAVFNNHNSYAFFLSHKKSFEKTTLQLWYPDEQTDSLIYYGPAHYESGTNEAPITLHANLHDLKKHIELVLSTNHFVDPTVFSHHSSGVPLLDLIASRHFRTPISPQYWQKLILNDS